MRDDNHKAALLASVRRLRPDLLDARASLGTRALRRSLEHLDISETPVDDLAEAMSDTSAQLTAATRPEDLSTDDVYALEAIVHTVLRPAILIQDGTFLPPPDEWAGLSAHRAAIDAAISRTCRIEASGAIDLDWLGTGFVIAPGLVATNRHVLELAASSASGRWELNPGVALNVDFAEELDGLAPREFPVIGIWGVHSQFDIAILSIPEQGTPAAMPSGPTSLATDDDVVVIGYPAQDSRRNDVEVMNRIFRGIYNVKRLLPGKVMGHDLPSWTLRHDASTLGGNSGSPVVSLTSGRLVGIHFRGRYLQWNEAIDLSR